MRLLITIFCFFLSYNSICQTPVFNPIDLSKNYSFNAISQDDYGFLWMGSTQGLVFYNGYEDLLISPELIHNPVYTINIQNDSLYAGSANGTVFLVDTKNRILLDSIKLNIDSRISDAICFEKTICFSSYGHGLFNYDKNSKQISPSELKTSSAHIYEMAALKEQKIAIASDRGIDIVDPKSATTFSVPDLPDIIITNLAYSADDMLWASSYNQSVFNIDLSDFKINNFPFDEYQTVHEIILHLGKVLVSSSLGVKYVTDQTGWSKNLFDSETQEFRSMLVDQENNLWLVNEHNPVWKASLYFGILDDLHVKGIQAVECIPGKLLLGNKEGLFAVNNKDGHSKIILDKNITCLNASKKYIVAGTYSNGLVLLDHDFKLLDVFSTKEGLPNVSILDVAIVDDSLLLVSTLSGVHKIPIYIHLGTAEFGNSSILHEEIGYAYVMEITSSKNRIFLGNDKAGYSIIEEGKLKSNKYFNSSKLKLGSINSIAEAQDGSVWMSSSKLGLLKFEADSLRRIGSINFNEEPYTSIVPLTSNNLLLIRASSIDLFDVQKEHVMYFNEEAKLVSEEPFINNYAFDNGRVWFVHHDKVYCFDPPSINQKIHPTTSIDQVEVDLERIRFDQKCFPQSKNNFKFSYTGGWLTDPSKLSYTYFLEGYDSDWRETKDRSVSYPHLPPGDYIFHVKAAENDYFSDEPISSFAFKIHQSFYNSAWFFLLLILMVTAVIRFLIKRDQREKELKSILEQKQVETQLINLKAQLNPHFLFNSFNTLSGLVEEDPQKGITYIENITDFYRQILELGDQKLIPLSKEMELVRLYQKLLKERFGNGFTIESKIINDQILIPPMTIQMLIENAIKHNQLSKKNPLKINIIQNDVQLEVSNNKSPKNLSVPSTGLGLKNINDRYRLLGFGEIHIEKTPQKFKVILPNYKIDS